jgi:hypothetical protein
VDQVFASSFGNGDGMYNCVRIVCRHCSSRAVCTDGVRSFAGTSAFTGEPIPAFARSAVVGACALAMDTAARSIIPRTLLLQYNDRLTGQTSTSHKLSNHPTRYNLPTL